MITASDTAATREVDQECLQAAVMVVMAIKRKARKGTKSRKRNLYLLRAILFMMMKIIFLTSYQVSTDSSEDE